VGFSGLSGAGVISGTVVMARRGRLAGPRQARDSRRGGRPRRCGSAGRHDLVARVMAGGVGGASGIYGTRAEGRREGKRGSGFWGDDRAQRKDFKINA
jgi:hypothetical protein